MLWRISPYVPTAVLAGLIFYFGFHALTGERGLLSAHQRAAAMEEKREELRNILAEREELESRAHYLRAKSLSADLVEERAHVILGFVDPRDYVIRVSKDRG